MTDPTPHTGWRKSSRSEPNGNCLEVTFTTNQDRVCVRDSKHAQAVLTFGHEDWRALLCDVRSGALDT